jgi:hypothetical protein
LRELRKVAAEIASEVAIQVQNNGVAPKFSQDKVQSASRRLSGRLQVLMCTRRRYRNERSKEMTAQASRALKLPAVNDSVSSEIGHVRSAQVALESDELNGSG